MYPAASNFASISSLTDALFARAQFSSAKELPYTGTGPRDVTDAASDTLCSGNGGSGASLSKEGPGTEG